MGMSQEVFKKEVFVQAGNKQPQGNNRNHNMTNILPVAFTWFFHKKQQLKTKTHLLLALNVKTEQETDSTESQHPDLGAAPALTLCSSRTQLRTCRQASTPSSSKGRCNGKSTVEKRELSGRAKVSERLSSWGNTSTSTRL